MGELGDSFFYFFIHFVILVFLTLLVVRMFVFDFFQPT